jgi:hypothetical protein
LADESHVIMRTIKGIGKKVDVRRFIERLAVGGDGARAELARAGLVGRLVPLEITLSIGPSGSAKVAEVVEALLGQAAFPHRAVRTALLAGDLSPLRLKAEVAASLPSAPL